MTNVVSLCSVVLVISLAKSQDIPPGQTIQRMENECRTIWEQLRERPEVIQRLAHRPEEMTATFARMLFSGKLSLAYHSFDPKSFANTVDQSRVQVFLHSATDTWRSPPKLEAEQFQTLCGIFKSLIELGHAPPKDLLNVIRPIYESYPSYGIGSTAYDLKHAAQAVGFEIFQPMSPEESRLAVSKLVQRLTESPIQNLDLVYIPIGGLSSADAAELFKQLIEQALARPTNWHISEAASRLTYELAPRIDAADAAPVYLFVAKQGQSADMLEQRFLSSAANFLASRVDGGITHELFPDLLQTFLEPSVVVTESWYNVLPKLSDDQRREIGERVIEAMQKVDDEDFLRFVGFWTHLEREIGNDLQPTFAAVFVNQCSSRYDKTRDRRFVEYIASVTAPESERRAAIKLAVEGLSQPESLNNDTFVFCLLLAIEKLDVSDLEAIVAALKRDLRAKKHPTTGGPSEIGYENWRKKAVDQLDLCYAELDKRTLTTGKTVDSIQQLEISSPYLARTFYKLAEDLAKSDHLITDLLDLFGPGKTFETPHEREAGLVVLHRQLERMPSEQRRRFVTELIELYRNTFQPLPLTYPKSNQPEALSEYFAMQSKLKFGDTVHQIAAILLIGAAKYLETDQSIDVLIEFAEHHTLSSMARGSAWGAARPVDEWLNGLDESQLTLVGERLGSKAFKSMPEFEGQYHGPASDDRRALEDLFSVFQGDQEQWLYNAVMNQCGNAFELEVLNEIKRTYKWRFR